jgi:hypothetical protein
LRGALPRLSARELSDALLALQRLHSAAATPAVPSAADLPSASSPDTQSSTSPDARSGGAKGASSSGAGDAGSARPAERGLPADVLLAAAPYVRAAALGMSLSAVKRCAQAIAPSLAMPPREAREGEDARAAAAALLELLARRALQLLPEEGAGAAHAVAGSAHDRGGVAWAARPGGLPVGSWPYLAGLTTLLAEAFTAAAHAGEGGGPPPGAGVRELGARALALAEVAALGGGVASLTAEASERLRQSARGLAGAGWA